MTSHTIFFVNNFNTSVVLKARRKQEKTMQRNAMVSHAKQNNGGTKILEKRDVTEVDVTVSIFKKM